MVKDGQKYLITSDNWFTGPDGQRYRAAWGTCHVKNIGDVFGFTPSRPSTNWYLEVGVDGKEIILAGCQIHFAIRCEERPIPLDGTYIRPDTGSIEYPCNEIYFAE